MERRELKILLYRTLIIAERGKKQKTKNSRKCCWLGECRNGLESMRKEMKLGIGPPSFLMLGPELIPFSENPYQGLW